MTGPERADDVTRRTYLAAERTWLAWWRSGIAAAAAALAVGAVVPDVVEGAGWPYVALGCGYALASLTVFALGAQQKTHGGKLDLHAAPALEQVQNDRNRGRGTQREPQRRKKTHGTITEAAAAASSA